MLTSGYGVICSIDIRQNTFETLSAGVLASIHVVVSNNKNFEHKVIRCRLHSSIDKNKADWSLINQFYNLYEFLAMNGFRCASKNPNIE